MSQSLIAPYLRKLKISSQERNVPNISEINALFLKHLLQERQPKHILEIGTANGYSTLCFAEAVMGSENKKISTDNSQLTTDITTIEYAWNAHNEAVEHFRNCKAKNIHAIWGDAKAVIPTLADRYFDFVFIDAMKREYVIYLELILPKCTPDALIVIDDVEKFGHKMENLYTWLSENQIPYRIEKTDEDDSIMIIERGDLPESNQDALS